MDLSMHSMLRRWRVVDRFLNPDYDTPAERSQGLKNARCQSLKMN